MVVEPPTSEVLTDPYRDEEGDDFAGMEKLFKDYIPEEHSDVAVEDPAHPHRPSLEVLTHQEDQTRFPSLMTKRS